MYLIDLVKYDEQFASMDFLCNYVDVVTFAPSEVESEDLPDVFGEDMGFEKLGLDAPLEAASILSQCCDSNVTAGSMVFVDTIQNQETTVTNRSNKAVTNEHMTDSSHQAATVLNQHTADSQQLLSERKPQQTVTNSQQNRAISREDPTVVSIPTGTNFSQQMIDTSHHIGAAMNQPAGESEQPLSERTPQ